MRLLPLLVDVIASGAFVAAMLAVIAIVGGR